jgi:hypothetical protein
MLVQAPLLSVQATSVVAYDPVWQDEDIRVLSALGITTTETNLVSLTRQSERLYMLTAARPI